MKEGLRLGLPGMGKNVDDDSRQTLIAEIETAFSDVRRGNGITLHQARVLDDYGDQEKQLKAREKDQDSRWQDVPSKTIQDLYDACFFLDAEGFRYYLPAYMIETLREDRHSGYPVGDWIVEDICRKDRRSDLRLLSESQMRVVAKFVEFVADRWDEGWADAATAAKGLRKFWHQFL